MKFVNDMSVGYHNTGHHNLGIKIPPKTQNTIRQPGQRSHPGEVPSSMLARSILCRPKAHGYSAIIYAWTSKSSPGFKRPNTHSAHGPTLEYDSSETSQAAEQSPPRSRVLAEAPGRASHLHLARGSEAALGEQENSTLGRALRGASARGGNSTSLETPLGRLGL